MTGGPRGLKRLVSLVLKQGFKASSACSKVLVVAAEAESAACAGVGKTPMGRSLAGPDLPNS